MLDTLFSHSRCSWEETVTEGWPNGFRGHLCSDVVTEVRSQCKSLWALTAPVLERSGDLVTVAATQFWAPWPATWPWLLLLPHLGLTLPGSSAARPWLRSFFVQASLSQALQPVCLVHLFPRPILIVTRCRRISRRAGHLGLTSEEMCLARPPRDLLLPRAGPFLAPSHCLPAKWTCERGFE